MFKRPEELIVLILALAWTALSYFAAAAFSGDAYTVLLITISTAVWAAVCFLIWQRNLSRHVWPLFLGTLTACWWPLLNRLDGGNTSGEAAWYAGWTFKLILALIPAAAGYAYKWKKARRLKIENARNFK
ncbi:hypothetical protein L4G92_04655 [Neisseria sp. ZJ106]|uniref:Uncharacterized protein n=1 Tax=Neisseria lisongii TaxID=2912188 RepID=A0ABY7RLF0_9NEIS|nr:hypothetical protein [Neisseria lisongii]MCF7521339.1 hypothetical protein [Neisseria lisongii]WCL72143.1 hypothetical protein PJU73_03275 [Neisseria lisongii]